MTRINPAKQTKPASAVTPYWRSNAKIRWSYGQPCAPLPLATSTGISNFSEATLRPDASGLFEITTQGLTFVILFASTADKMDSILLPLPEISIARFNTDTSRWYSSLNKILEKQSNINY